ncbi:patatin-like phospholipase family protein [Saccharomonospora azurea]|uniref:patatin-like phospholipase family protein n=1 Tax=Saccharomonospora azurea TaxID=40988 RepID=UPI0024095650|nr:patatin-like phospholipase family protein [Saccharomonospora azurea]
MADNRKALVLGAGGITGIAWELGLLAGLVERGIDLATADLVVGTSAGAVAGAQLLGGVDLRERYERELEGAKGERAGRMGLRNLVRLGLAGYRASDALDARRRIGELALAARTESEEDRRTTVATWLGGVDTWPRRLLKVTAVDAATGEFTVFDRDSGVDLVAAVAASCASPCVRPPSTLAGSRFIDGGVRSPSNADLAEGYGRIVVLTPVETAGNTMSSPAEELARLRERSRVVHVSPDAEARPRVGRTMLQMLRPARRAKAAAAGYAQAERVAEQIDQLWST